LFCFTNCFRKYVTKLWSRDSGEKERLSLLQAFYNRWFPAAAFSLTAFVYSRVKSSEAD